MLKTHIAGCGDTHGGVSGGGAREAGCDAVVDDVARAAADCGGHDAVHVREGQVPLLRQAAALQQVSLGIILNA